MAGRATASPPAGPGPPPSSCPAVCGLRSSSSPCLRGPEQPEPRAGRRRRGGPRCRCWPPPAGRAALSGCACALCSPTSARGGGGMLPGAPGTDGGGGCSRGGRAEPSAPHSWIPHSNFKSRLLLPPPPMGARPRPPSASPLAPARVRPGPQLDGQRGPRRGWTGRTRPGTGAGHPLPCGDTAERWGPARAESPGGTLQHRDRGKPGEARGRDAAGMDRPALSLLREGRAPAEQGWKGQSAGRAAGAAMGPPERCLSLAPDARPATGPRGCLLPRPPRLRAEITLLVSVHVGHRPLLPCPQSPAAPEWSPRPEPVAPRLAGHTSPASSSQRGSVPSRGKGPITPHGPWEQPVPPVPPARRTRPELPLPVRVPAAAGAGPDDRQRRGDRRGTHGPERGARPAQRSRPLPSQAFLQRDPSKGFPASTPHFDIPRLSQDPASKCLEFFFCFRNSFLTLPQ